MFFLRKHISKHRANIKVSGHQKKHQGPGGTAGSEEPEFGYP